MSTTEIDRIMLLASIRRYICESIHGEDYILQDNIQLPSPDGDYKDYDAVVMVQSQSQKQKVADLFKGIDVQIAVIQI